MSNRTVSWTRIDRAAATAVPVIPAGMLGARALVQLGARTRTLVVAGRYDRAAIMAAACKAATAFRSAAASLAERPWPLRSRPPGRSPRPPTAPLRTKGGD